MRWENPMQSPMLMLVRRSTRRGFCQQRQLTSGIDRSSARPGMLPQLPIAGETFTVFRAKLGEHPIVICLLGSEPPKGVEKID
jgi:hypothetical protein